jgi:flagellar hook-associated protein 3 FlgL
MLSNVNSIGQQFLANLQILQEHMAQTQAQVSSGTRISQPSDDPAALGDVLQLESDIGRLTQVTGNLNQVKGQVDSAETALQSATQLLSQANTLGVQGANGALDAAGRKTLGDQVGQILSQLVSVSQTKFEGTYVFGGDQDSSASYAVNPSNPNGVDRLSTTSSTRVIQDATGVTFATSKTAQDIFDHRNSDDSVASDNVFAALSSLRAALNNNDQPGITAALDSVKQSQDYLAQQLAYYGGVQNEVASALDIAGKFQLQDQASLGQLKDTDVAAAAISLTQEQTNLQASLQAQAATPKTSLFSFM